MKITTVNPFDGQPIAHYDRMNQDQIAEVLDQSQQAFKAWRCLPIDTRIDSIKQLAVLLKKNRQTSAALITQEMGKPIIESLAEVDKCAALCHYYIEHAAGFLADQVKQDGDMRQIVSFQPLGAVLGVMPWNFPFWQVFRFAIPCLIAGNVAALKHASNVSGCALAIEGLFAEAGFQPGCFTTLVIDSNQVADVIAADVIKAVSLTGSCSAGAAVAQQAGKMLKKSVMELGGSDPYIVLNDADIDLAVSCCVQSRYLNAGQSCIAAKRIIVVESIRTVFEQRFVAAVKKRVMGDPADELTNVGPMARVDLRDQLHEQVKQSVKQGARCLLGGECPEGAGAFYPLTVLTDVGPGMRAYDEEVFGPVAVIISVVDQQQAVAVANDSQFGLGAAIFTQDRALGERMAKSEIDSGVCFVNDFVKSDPRLPFGGIKMSGYGRELAVQGLMEFVNIKTVVVA